jgi:hypothetical protein
MDYKQTSLFGVGVCVGDCLCCDAQKLLNKRSTSEPVYPIITLRPNPGVDMAIPKRPNPSCVPNATQPVWEDPEFARDYPSLHAFLFDPKYEDGSPRFVGSVSIFVQMGILKMAVNDKDRNVVAFASAPTWAELLFVVDEGICKDSLDWKASSKSFPAKNPPY